jgi:hypothetical protein
MRTNRVQGDNVHEPVHPLDQHFAEMKAWQGNKESLETTIEKTKDELTSTMIRGGRLELYTMNQGEKRCVASNDDFMGMEVLEIGEETVEIAVTKQAGNGGERVLFHTLSKQNLMHYIEGTWFMLIYEDDEFITLSPLPKSSR